MPEIGFLVLAFVLIVSAISMIAAERVVHSAAFLLVAMLAAAGILVLLGAEFLAAMQVMVYAGAVMVMVLFTIMLTVGTTPSLDRRRELSAGAALIAVVFGGLVYAVLASKPLAAGAVEAPQTSVARFGEILFTQYVLPFELASVVLLIALVAAVFIAMDEEV